MTSYVTPKKGFPFICYVGLVSQSTGQFQSSPTLAVGDFKISKDGGALNNLATLPAAIPASSKSVKISLDSDETNADNLVIIGSDAAGSEWDDIFLNIQTTVQQIDDLASQTSVNTIDDFLDTEVAAIKAVTDALPNAGALITIQSDLDNIQTRLPAALSGDGFMKADLKSIEDELTSGNNATLKLKMLDINNSVGHGVDIVGSSASIQLSGYQANAIGLDIQALGTGININSDTGVYISSTGDGIDVVGGLDGVYISGAAGKSINAPQDIAVSDGNLTLAAIANAVWTFATRVLTAFGFSVTVGTNNDKTGYTVTTAEHTNIADALLKRDMSTVTGEAARSPLNALRKLRNKVSYSSPTLTVYKEDGTTSAYTQTVTSDSDQEPFKELGN